MWSFLRRNQEPALVGTAMALVVLACLSPAQTASRALNPSEGTSGQSATTALAAPFADVPRDHDFYRTKWRQIANDFYALHPVDGEPKPAERSSPEVVTASLSDQSTAQFPSSTANLPQRQQAIPTISPVSHVTSSSSTLATPASPTASIQASWGNRTFSGQSVVATAFAAGILCFLAFRVVWPLNHSQAGQENRVLEGSDSLRIELPARLVSIRPTWRQRLKPIVLTTSYLAATVAAWAVCG